MGRSKRIYWLCGFCAAIIGFDVFCWNRISEQIASKNYLPVAGRVTHCEPANRPANLSRKAAAFGYGYRVNGRGYAGNTYRYLETVTPTEISSQLIVGSVIPVFYNPDNPADAILARDLVEDDFGKMLQLGMLNLMLFSFLGLWARSRVRKVFSAPQLWQS
jgi:hypothetical protein